MAQAEKPAVANSTFGAPVYRGDGTRLYGLDAELELKAQEKRDTELESSIEQWIEKVIGETLEPKGNLQKSLKSGVALCKMMNKLWPGSIKTINTKPIGMMEMENIGFYLKSCWNIGVPSAELFVTSDLYNNKHFQAVLDNLLAVARAAHAQEDYDGPQLAAVVVPSAEAKKRRAKKHREVNPQPAGMWNEQAAETPETQLRRQLEEQMDSHVRLQQELERVQGLLAKEKYKREELQAQLSKAVSRDARKSRLLADAAKALEPTVSAAAADAKIAEVKAKLASELETERKEKSQLQIELQRMQERAHRKSLLLKTTQSEQEELKAMLKREEEQQQSKRRTELGAVEGELSKVKTQLSDVQEKYARKEKSESELRSQIRLLEQEAMAKAERIDTLENDVLRSQSEKAQREAEAAEAGREVLLVREELAAVLKGKSQAEVSTQSEVASKSAEIAELASRVGHLKGQLEDVAGRLSAANKEKAALTTERDNLRAELKRSEAKAAAAETKATEALLLVEAAEAEAANLCSELEVQRKGESAEATQAAAVRASAAESERKAQVLAGQLVELKRELQLETEKSAARVQAAERASEEGRTALAQELEALKAELNSRQKSEEERAQQVDDFKRRAATRVQAAERELATVKAELKQAQESEQKKQSSLAGELAQLRMKHVTEAEEAARAKVQLTGQLVEERRARAAIASELELAHSHIASLQLAVAAAKQQAQPPSSPPQVTISIPASTPSPPMSLPSVSSYPTGSKLSSSTSSAGSETGAREGGKELKKTKSEKRIRADSTPKPGDAVAALGRAALSQSAVLAQTQPKPELQRHRTQLLRSEAAKRADEDANKEKETAEAAQLRKRDERRLRESVPAILKGEEVDLHSVKRLYTICSTDVGRRAFIKQLKVTMKETKSLVLPSTSFEVLVYLYNYCIQAMQTANKIDFRACMIFMYTAQALCRKTPDGGTEYLAEHIRSHGVWQSVVFWEEYFWTELRKKYDEQNKELGDTVDSDTFANLFCPLILSSFTHDMILTWDVPVQTATEFITDMVAANALSKKHYDALLTELRDYVAARQNANLKKQADETLRKRHRATQQLTGGGAGARRPGPGEDLGEDGGLMIGTAAKWNRASRMVQQSRQ